MIHHNNDMEMMVHHNNDMEMMVHHTNDVVEMMDDDPLSLLPQSQEDDDEIDLIICYNQMVMNHIVAQNTCTTAAMVAIVRNSEDRKELRKKYQRHMAHHSSRNIFRNPPSHQLQLRNILNDVLYDRNREYCRKLTHLDDWEFFALAERLQPLILLPRSHNTLTNINTEGRRGYATGGCKADHQHRLFYTLCWLSSGQSFQAMEFYTGCSKTTLCDDIKHILKCIIKALDNELQWPSVEERNEMAHETVGIMEGCIGIIDCTEHRINRPVDSSAERRTFSGKLKTNTKKTVTVIDKRGYYIYVETGIDGRMNDRDIFTSSPLYLNRGLYFSAGERLIGDGIFAGDGPITVSLRNPGNDIDSQYFNNAFKLMRMTVETSYKRVEDWFPILGNAKKMWNYSTYLLQLSIHAAVRLHNWLLRIRDLNYNVATNPSYLFYDYM